MARRNSPEPRDECDDLLAHLHDLLTSSAAGPRLQALTPPSILAEMERLAAGRRSTPEASPAPAPGSGMAGDMLPVRGSASPEFVTAVVKNESPETAASYQRSVGTYSPARPFSRASGEKIAPQDAPTSGTEGAGEFAQLQAGEMVMATAKAWKTGNSEPAISHQTPPAGGELVVSPSEDEQDGALAASDPALVVYEPGSEPHVVPPRAVQRGRPPVIDEACKSRIVSLISYGMSLRQAAARVGVHHTSLLKAMDRDEQFADQVAAARFDAGAQPLLTVIRASRSNWRAAAWLAQHLGQRAWKRDQLEEREQEETRLAAIRKRAKE